MRVPSIDLTPSALWRSNKKGLRVLASRLVASNTHLDDDSDNGREAHGLDGVIDDQVVVNQTRTIVDVCCDFEAAV